MLMCYFVSCAAFVCRHFPMMQCAFWPLLSQPQGGARFVKTGELGENWGMANTFFLEPIDTTHMHDMKSILYTT